MQEYLKYIIVAITILGLDFLWIFINLPLYTASVKAVQKTPLEVNYYAAIAAYAVIIFACLYISIPFTKVHVAKNIDMQQKIYYAFLYAGTVGFAIHAIYNLTSMAIYKNYTFNIALVDTVWGTFMNTFAVFVYLMLP